MAEPVAPYLVENSTANSNFSNGFEVDHNESNTIKFTGNNAENNGGWGYLAEVRSGPQQRLLERRLWWCHNVGGCHLNP